MFSSSNDSLKTNCLILVPYFMLLFIPQAINPHICLHEMIAVPAILTSEFQDSGNIKAT